MIDIDSIDFDKGDGLIPAIIQDADSFQVLMLGYMNRSALEITLEKKRVTFFSRSKQRLWTKGETSGNYLDLVELQQDCDNDTLLVLAHPQGPTCHTGNESCFFKKDFKPTSSPDFLSQLESLIVSRKKERPEGSYTTHLFNEGLDLITQKVGEEAIETVIDAKNNNPDEFKGEVADLLYHLLVLLAEKDISLEEVIKKLKSRHKK